MDDEEQKEEQSVSAGAKEDPSSGQHVPLTESRVWDVLRECYDPEIPVNIVDLGLVYEVKIQEEVPNEADIHIVMTLTAPGCGMGPMIAADVKRRAEQIPGVRSVTVELVFEPAWNTGMMSETARLILNMS
jgi:metal-sulfur cluster biosynthetic enzyme